MKSESDEKYGSYAYGDHSQTRNQICSQNLETQNEIYNFGEEENHLVHDHYYTFPNLW